MKPKRQEKRLRRTYTHKKNAIEIAFMRIMKPGRFGGQAVLDVLATSTFAHSPERLSPLFRTSLHGSVLWLCVLDAPGHVRNIDAISRGSQKDRYNLAFGPRMVADRAVGESVGSVSGRKPDGRARSRLCVHCLFKQKQLEAGYGVERDADRARNDAQRRKYIRIRYIWLHVRYT